MRRFITVAALIAATTTVSAEPIVVIVPRPETGPYADVGRAMAAVVDATAATTDVLPGRRVELRAMSCPPDGRWPADLRADAIIGQSCRGEAAEGMTAVRIHVSLGEPFTARRPRGLKIPVAATPATAVLVADVASATQAETTIAVVHDRSQQGRTTADAIVDGLAKSGRRSVKRFAIAGAQRTFATVIDELRRESIGNLVLVTFPVEAAAFAMEVRDALPTVRVTAPNLLAGAEFGRLAGPAADGIRMVARTTVSMMSQQTPATAALVARIEQAGVSMSPAALHLAAALDAYVATVRAAGTTESARVRAGLTERSDTRIGPILFEETGEARLPVWAVHVWRDGRLVPVP